MATAYKILTVAPRQRGKCNKFLRIKKCVGGSLAIQILRKTTTTKGSMLYEQDWRF